MRPPSPGIQIGRYSLVRQLGAGGMGEVWEAMLEGPQGFRKPVALKLLRQRRPGSPLEREALLQEARLGALLHHPNVVGVHALEEHDGSWIVVMELVRGASVSELGRVERDGGALDAGREHLQQAAAIAREYADPVLFSIVLTSLGDLERRADALPRARAVLDEARTALRDVASPEPLASLLCEVALLELEEGSRDAASTTLAEAEALAVGLAVPPESRLGRRLREVGTRCLPTRRVP
jgi:hypothetical protein